MQEQVELFYLGDQSMPCGAVVTTIGASEISCHVHFTTPDGHHGGGRAVIHVAGSITAWTSLSFTSGGVSIHASRDGEDVIVAGARAPHDGVVVPSYGLSALVLELVQGPDRAVDFVLLEESTSSTGAVSPARLERTGTEDVRSPFLGLVADCERVELTVGARRTNTYWVHDGVLVASDWAGARSYLLPTAAADGLRATLGA